MNVSGVNQRMTEFDPATTNATINCLRQQREEGKKKRYKSTQYHHRFEFLTSTLDFDDVRRRYETVVYSMSNQRQSTAIETIFISIILVHDGQLIPAFEFIMRHSEIQFHFFAFSICTTVGQLLIFYTIKNDGAVVFAIIMTTRVSILE